LSNALAITRDIVVAAFGSTNAFFPSVDSGKSTAEFIQAVFDKVKELEDQIIKENNKDRDFGF